MCSCCVYSQLSSGTALKRSVVGPRTLSKARVPKLTFPRACHPSALQQNLPMITPPSSAALQKHIKAGILQFVCKPQQIRLAFPRGEVKLHASNLTFHTSGGAPAARSLLQNVDLLDLSCRRRTTITSVPREDAGTNTFLRG